MLDYLARHWWYLTVRGALAIIFGLLAVIWPGITLFVLAVVFGLYALVEGLTAAASAFRAEGGHRMPLILEAVFGVLFGLVALFWPGATIVVLTVLIGAWAVVTGVFEIIAAIRLRAEISGEWLFVLGGALSVFFGLLIWVWPIAGAVALALVIGVYAILFGVVLVALSLRVRRISEERGTDTL